MRRGEQGAALLSVLMLVALVALLATLALERTRLGTRLAGNAIAGEQALTRLHGASALLLARIEGRGATLGEPLTLDMGDGAEPVIARLGEGANCFNLNSLVTGGSEDDLTVRPVGVLQFAALMRALGVDARIAGQVAAAAADWIDSDARAEPGGGEDGFYAGLAPSYLPANRFMADVSELRAVRGVTPALYRMVRPWLCALPTADLAPINVNSLAPRQAPLLAMLAPQSIGPEAARAFLAARPAGGYASREAFWAIPARAGLTPPAEVAQQVSVETRWIAASLRAQTGDQVREMRLLIDARKRPFRIVAVRMGDAP